jgi:nucleoside-diphosphate-sugar epimerase
MLKKAGFTKYSNLKKAELERLLDSGTPSATKTPRTPRAPKTPKSASGEKKPRKPRVAKPKPFVPEPVKVETPVVAEPQIPKIIYISSTNLFQKFDNPITEDSKVSPSSSYLYSKYASEIIIQKYAHNRFKYNTLRISAPFGNRMRNPTVILKFIDLARSNKNIQIFDNRYQTFTYIDVILDVVLELLQKDVLSGTYNITGGESVDMIELAEIILRIIPSKSQLIIPIDTKSDVKNNKIYSLDKIKNSGIHFKAQRLEDSLRNLIQQLELNK